MSVLLANITPIFILGMPRSGTTLSLSLLDGHPQILTDVGDSRFFNWYFRTKNKNVEQKILLADEILLHMFNPGGIYYKKLLSHIPYRDVKKYFTSLIRESKLEPKDFLEAYICSIGLASGHLTDRTLYWVEKTPHNEFFLDKLNQWWPEAKYIHVVRDPRDVYTSSKTRDIKNARKITPIDKFAFTWGKSIKALNRYRKIIGNDKYYVLKYEELVQNLEDTLSQVVEFLGICDDETLRQPTKGLGRVPWGGNIATGDKYYYVNPAAASGKWKSSLSEEEVRKIESVLNKEMVSVGYEMMNDTASLRFYYIGTLKNYLREVKFRVTHF